MIEVRLIKGPLLPTAAWPVDGAGAVLAFEGVVRPLEDERPLRGLEYDVYEPMARRQLQQLGESVAHEHRLLGLRVEHSVGFVAVGECSFRLRVASPHRKDVIAALDAFIDRMKRDVAIWKVPCFADEPAGSVR